MESLVDDQCFFCAAAGLRAALRSAKLCAQEACLAQQPSLELCGGREGGFMMGCPIFGKLKRMAPF